MIKSLLALLIFSSVIYSQGKLIYSPYSDTVEASFLSESRADSVFRYVISNNNVIEFDDCNICKSRAHILCRVFENNFPGIITAKAWLFADCTRQSQREKYRYKPNVYLTNSIQCKDWAYHVAPVIITSSDTFVIDPATQKKPVKLSEWAYKLIPEGGEGFMIFKKSRYFIFPDDENGLFEDEKIIWQEDKEILTDDGYSRLIDEMVRTSLGLIEPWKMNERVQALKKIINSSP